MGGVRTDLDGRTSVPGLYAAGEVACTGVHGANRLASNSLLEGLVYGARAARAMRARMQKTPSASTLAPQASVEPNGSTADVDTLIQRVQSLMWQNVAVVREGKALRQTLADLTSIATTVPQATGRRAHEAANILQTGMLITRSALARQESRGAHYRLDYPIKDDAKYKKHSVVQGESVRFV
jgi:L-aspartate oxidase